VIARRWADEYAYPLRDVHDLARVAQFIAVRTDAMFPKEAMVQQLRVVEPDFSRPDEPHGVLARLPLPLYVTTNYDDFMVRALMAFGKNPRVAICRWNGSPALEDSLTVVERDFHPTPANPLVYHLYGHSRIPESLVLTEDDYLDFLVAVSQDARLLPHQVQAAFAGSSLLPLGHGAFDWGYRVLQRGLLARMEASLRRISITVQLPPDEPAATEYLTAYFGARSERVYWGTVADFAAELESRWREFDSGRS
jgi:hypothetical protein